MKNLVKTGALALAMAGWMLPAVAENAGERVSAAVEANKRDRVLMVLGGKIARPRSQQGVIAFVNSQKDVADTNLWLVANTFARATGFNVTVRGGSATGSVPKGEVQVRVVSEAGLPALLVAPEDGWAQVNVAALRKGLPGGRVGDALLAARCRKECMRAFSIVCGGFSVRYAGSVLNAASAEDLDSTTDELPYDTLLLFPKYLKQRGITPVEMVTYRKACQEGWAPPPANEYQRAAKELLERRAREKADKSKQGK